MASHEVTMHNFEDIVDKHSMVVLDFWAAWCGPCRTFSPFYEKMAEANPDIFFGKVDVEKSSDLASAFQVQGVPAIIAFQKGEIIFEQSGLPCPEDFAELLERLRSEEIEDY
jgi:thioredoxin